MKSDHHIEERYSKKFAKSFSCIMSSNHQIIRLWSEVEKYSISSFNGHSLGIGVAEYHIVVTFHMRKDWSHYTSVARHKLHNMTCYRQVFGLFSFGTAWLTLYLDARRFIASQSTIKTFLAWGRTFVTAKAQWLLARQASSGHHLLIFWAATIKKKFGIV